jgi:hypothetical protein
MQPILKYLLMVAIQYNSNGLTNTYRCDYTRAMIEAASTFETLANFYQTTEHYNPDDSHL